MTPFDLASGFMAVAEGKRSATSRTQIERPMRIVTLMLALAAAQIGRAGEIEKDYWQQQTTNSVGTGTPFSGPKLPSTTHGVTEIGIERTACFGSCPVYVCLIRSDAVVRYHGGAHVDRIGDWETKIDPYKFHNLANFIAESGYSQMQDTFATSVTDGDTVYTTFLLKGRRKVFRNYASSGPPKLWALQQLIDGLLVGAIWNPSASKPSEK